MTRLVTVCPVIAPPRAGLLESWTHSLHYVIVNGAHDVWHDIGRDHGHWSMHVPEDRSNLGCPTSWNLGFRHAQSKGATHVAVMSQSCVLAGGTAQLADLLGHCDDFGLMTPFSFHCVIVRVGLWQRLDGFDESMPIWCDIDFIRRAWLHYPTIEFRGVRHLRGLDERNIAVRSGAVAASVYEADEHHYADKWGGVLGHETYMRPWDPSSTSPDASTPRHLFGM